MSTHSGKSSNSRAAVPPPLSPQSLPCNLCLCPHSIASYHSHVQPVHDREGMCMTGPVHDRAGA